MNAGANGGETKECWSRRPASAATARSTRFTNADMKFVYRNSGVDPSIIFTSARFRGEHQRRLTRSARG